MYVKLYNIRDKNTKNTIVFLEQNVKQCDLKLLHIIIFYTVKDIFITLNVLNLIQMTIRIKSNSC